MSINVELKNITYRIKPWNAMALECHDFCFKASEKYLLVGQNQDGAASAVISLCAGWAKPQRGMVLYDGEFLKKIPISRRRRMAFIDGQSQLDPWLTVNEYLGLCGNLSGREADSVFMDVQKVLKTGLKTDLSKRPIGSLGKLDDFVVRIFASAMLSPLLICADLDVKGFLSEEKEFLLQMLESSGNGATLICTINGLNKDEIDRMKSRSDFNILTALDRTLVMK